MADRIDPRGGQNKGEFLRIASNSPAGANVLEMGDWLESASRFFYIALGWDGVLRMFNERSGDHPLPCVWQSGQPGVGRSPYRLELLDNGLLHIIDGTGAEIWRHGPFGTAPVYTFIMQDDQNAVLYQADRLDVAPSKAKWATAWGREPAKL
jgi:hypothetical protein